MKNILISGASFAGLCTAFWFRQLGYQVTLVEINSGLKRGGTPVNIIENTVDIVKRMGLFEQIKANHIPMQGMTFKNGADNTVGTTPAQSANEEYEVERDRLLYMLYNLIKNDVVFRFDDSITSLQETETSVTVTFKNGAPQTFDLVFGCDGIHSAVRRLCFGHEDNYVCFLGIYFSITIIDELLIPEFTTQMYSEPGKTIMLNAYNGKTDICLCFRAEKEIPYDYRNETQMREIIYTAFKNAGWRTPELLTAVKGSETFYFDKLCQLKMPNWTKGRVALVGDAAYCASPAAGRGGSLAIDGATALYEAFLQHADHVQAFSSYNKSFRPFIEEIQQTVVDFSLDFLIPKTAQEIENRSEGGFSL